MVERELRIGVEGRISAHTADALGVGFEVVGDRVDLVATYVDQAQLTGLLLHLSDLHIAFDRIEVVDIAAGDRVQEPAAGARRLPKRRMRP